MLLDLKAEELLHTYRTKGMLDDPRRFGVTRFDKDILSKAGFSREGLSDFFLYEKSFRLTNKNTSIRLKAFFQNDEYVNNGIDIGGCRLSSVLKNYFNRYGKDYFQKIEVCLDESLEFGSLLIDDVLDLRFQNFSDKRGAFQLIGISTDASSLEGWSEKRINIDFAKKTKKLMNSRDMDRASNKSKAVRQLVEHLDGYLNS